MFPYAIASTGWLIGGLWGCGFTGDLKFHLQHCSQHLTWSRSRSRTDFAPNDANTSGVTTTKRRRYCIAVEIGGIGLMSVPRCWSSQGGRKAAGHFHQFMVRFASIQSTCQLVLKILCSLFFRLFTQATVGQVETGLSLLGMRFQASAMQTWMQRGSQIVQTSSNRLQL